MIRFLSKYSDLNAHDAIKKVVESEGDFLILGFGYVTPGQNGKINQYLEFLNDQLLKNRRLKVEIHVGLMFNWNEHYKNTPINERKEKFLELHKTEVNDTLTPFKNLRLSNAVVNRVKILGIPNFHAKFCLRTTCQQKFIGVSGTMGSSNLTNAALFSEDRSELDIYLSGGQENEVLQDFSLCIKKLHDQNTNQKFASYCLGERKVLFHESEEYLKQQLAIGEASDEHMREESYLSMYADSYDEEREALFESDLDQDIYYDTEENLRTYYR